MRQQEIEFGSYDGVWRGVRSERGRCIEQHELTIRVPRLCIGG